MSRKSIRKAAVNMDRPIPDGTFYAPGHEPVEMPPMEVKNWPQEWEDQLPGGHTKRAPGSVSELVRHLVALMKGNKE